jgi:hypothetical protein
LRQINTGLAKRLMERCSVPVHDGDIGGEMRSVGEVQTAAQVAAVFTCEWCGQQVELRTGEAGPAVLDTRAFLSAHNGCLDRVKQGRCAAH